VLREREDRSGTSTRKRGLDTETKKALLEKHLQEQGDAGAPLSELQQVLPSDSKRAIQRLLDELRRAKRIELKGQRRWARWVRIA
jgi:hypothetical protein